MTDLGGNSGSMASPEAPSGLRPSGYDPGRGADFTVADVLAWARTKPADEEYDYCSNGNCAVAQFLKETGRAKAPSVSPVGWRKSRRAKKYYPIRFEISDAANSGEGPDTFGKFVAELERVSR